MQTLARSGKPVEGIHTYGGQQVTIIEGLDLSRIKAKLMEQAPEGKGWTQAQADEAELWYRRYLIVIAKYPDFVHVPNEPIDAFWHQHILDTRAYARDCEAVFGRFMHHYPYFGLDGDADERDKAFEETNRLYHIEFGVDCRSMQSFFGASTAPDCNNGGQNCGGSGCKNSDGG